MDETNGMISCIHAQTYYFRGVVALRPPQPPDVAGVMGRSMRKPSVLIGRQIENNYNVNFFKQALIIPLCWKNIPLEAGKEVGPRLVLSS